MHAILLDVWLAAMAPPGVIVPDEPVPYLLGDALQNHGRFALPKIPDELPTPPPLTIGPAPPPPVSDPLPVRDGRRSAQGRVDLAVAAVTTRVSISDPKVLADPIPRSPSWETGEQLRVPITERVFLFGQFQAASPAIEHQPVRWSGRSGFGWDLKPVSVLPAVHLKTGQGVRNEPGRAWLSDQSELFLEMTTQLEVPIIGLPIDVEYTGVALPAVTPADADRVKTDIRVALPMTAGRFHVGARWTSEDVPSPSPWVDRAQLYLGLDLRR